MDRASFWGALVLTIVAVYLLGDGLSTYVQWDSSDIELAAQQQVVLLKAIAQIGAALVFSVLSLPLWMWWIKGE